VGKYELDVQVNAESGVQLVELDGPVDSATIEVFKARLDPVCNQPGAKVLLDCQQLTYLNSRAIGLLVTYHRRLLQTHGRLALCRLNTKLVRSLDLLQLGKTLFTYETREDGLESF